MFDLRDPVSSGSHLLTCVWAIFATLLLRRITRNDSPRRISATVFGVSMIILYAASGLYHGLKLPREELRLYQKIDQSAIFGLIAGTCTPTILLLLTGRFQRCMIWGIWAMAAIGIGCLWLLPKVPHSVTVSIYLGMGWFGFMGLWQYYLAVGWRGISWAIGGAFFYTFGAVCELAHWPVIWPGVIGAHEVLHVCDSAGTFCHFVFVVRYVLVYQPPLTTSQISTTATDSFDSPTLAIGR
ncbi:MAG: hemolysin III family protein [Planctomycetes bacterium]|nr:hemolysin III family protein [Planctomycetota bacterium]